MNPKTRPPRRWIATAAATLACLAAATAASASTIPVRSGGVTTEEFAALNQEAGNYSLKLVMAARGSGAYLADVDVSVASLATGEVVLAHRSEGPLLLAALPPGRYRVTARFADVVPGASRTVTRVIQVPARGHVQAVLRFDTGDTVSAESPANFRTR